MISIVFLGYTYFILGLFALEMIAKLLVFGPKYFKNPWHLFDVIFITTSLALHIVFTHVWNVGFGLILGRVFRIVRFGHGVAETTEQEAQHKLHVLEHQLFLKDHELVQMKQALTQNSAI